MVYGTNVNAIILEKDEVVEIVLNSLDPGKHPFHLHGHDFQAVVRGEEEAGIYNGSDIKPAIPMRRDTFMVKPNSYIVLRFRANNPDMYSFPFLPFHTNLINHASGFSIAISNGTLRAALVYPLLKPPMSSKPRSRSPMTISTHARLKISPSQETPPEERITYSTSMVRLFRLRRYRPASRRKELWRWCLVAWLPLSAWLSFLGKLSPALRGKPRELHY